MTGGGKIVFVFSSRRRHTRFSRDWSSDVCSSDLTAGGTLGILIPPSVMIIVYAAVAGQSVVKLYAAAMFPGFFLAFLYLVYVIGWALINPKIAPPLPESETRVPVPEW